MQVFLGVCSASEWVPIKRDIELIRKTGCRYHVCHISTKESVELIRNAKKDGVDITCETGPHYLILDDMMLKEDGFYKMNPPIRSKEDRKALIEGDEEEGRKGRKKRRIIELTFTEDCGILFP